jgi:TPR repeat protein
MKRENTPSTQLTRKLNVSAQEVEDWNCEKLCRWLEEMQIPLDIIQKCRDAQLDGVSFLACTLNELVTMVHLPLGPAKYLHRWITDINNSDVVSTTPSNPTNGKNDVVDVKSIIRQQKCIKLEDLKLGEKIGAGGEGTIYVGTYAGEEYAVKKILGINSSELDTILSLDDPCLIKCSYWCQDKVNVYYLMEHMDMTLSDALYKKKYSLTDLDKFKIIQDIVHGCKVLHSKHWIHKDLKPDNILLKRNKSGSVMAKISDFGISKLKNTEMDISMTIGMTGTIPYLPYDYVLNHVYGYFTDVYAFGVILFEILFEERPWSDCQTTADIYSRLVDGIPIYKGKTCGSQWNDVFVIMKKCVGDRDQRDTFEALEKKFLLVDTSKLSGKVPIQDSKEVPVVSSKIVPQVVPEVKIVLKQPISVPDSTPKPVQKPVIESPTRPRMLPYPDCYEDWTLNPQKCAIMWKKHPQNDVFGMFYLLSLKDPKDGTALLENISKKTNLEVSVRGLLSYYKKDYKTALELWSNDFSSPVSIFLSGRLYYYGEGVDIDVHKAIRTWLTVPDLAIAQHYIGFCHFRGLGVVRYYGESLRWFRLAAEQGYSDSQDHIGLHFHGGLGVQQDLKEAVKWHEYASNQGLPIGQNNLGNCYYYGNGVNQNYEIAVKLYRLAAEQGLLFGFENLGRCLYNGHGVAQDYTEAMKVFLLAADKRSPVAQCYIGKLYFFGFGVSINYIPTKITHTHRIVWVIVTFMDMVFHKIETNLSSIMKHLPNRDIIRDNITQACVITMDMVPLKIIKSQAIGFA